jgi:hypothetical protein
MCRIVQDVRILRFHYSYQIYFGTITFRRMSQDVGKLKCRITQFSLYPIFISKAQLGTFFTTYQMIIQYLCQHLNGQNILLYLIY